jgi:hypothetical protein
VNGTRSSSETIKSGRLFLFRVNSYVSRVIPRENSLAGSKNFDVSDMSVFAVEVVRKDGKLDEVSVDEISLSIP